MWVLVFVCFLHACVGRDNPELSMSIFNSKTKDAAVVIDPGNLNANGEITVSFTNTGNVPLTFIPGPHEEPTRTPVKSSSLFNFAELVARGTFWPSYFSKGLENMQWSSDMFDVVLVNTSGFSWLKWGAFPKVQFDLAVNQSFELTVAPFDTTWAIANQVGGLPVFGNSYFVYGVPQLGDVDQLGAQPPFELVNAPGLASNLNLALTTSTRVSKIDKSIYVNYTWTNVDQTAPVPPHDDEKILPNGLFTVTLSDELSRVCNNGLADCQSMYYGNCWESYGTGAFPGRYYPARGEYNSCGNAAFIGPGKSQSGILYFDYVCQAGLRGNHSVTLEFSNMYLANPITYDIVVDFSFCE
jgi:hypothetical protein